MSFFSLLLRNLFYHWRGNLAVFLGMALGSAVLTGALFVGDSLRGSLHTLTLEQLGWIDEALLPGRFFRAGLAQEVAAERTAPALLLQGSASRKNSEGTTRVGKVQIFGVDASFWPAEALSAEAHPAGADFWSGEAREVVLNRTLAQALGAHVDDMVTLHLQKPDATPRETLLGKRQLEDVIEPIDLKVRHILADEGMARFTLQPTPQPVRNAFVPMGLLQKRLDLRGRANALFVARAKPTLQAELHSHLTLDDWGLRYRTPRARAEAFYRFLARHSEEDALKKVRWHGRVPEELADSAEKNRGLLTREQVIAYYEKHRDYDVLESQRMLLEPAVEHAVERLVPDRDNESAPLPRWKLTPLLIYLADTLLGGKHEVPYAIVASDDTAFVKDGKTQYVLTDDQILLMSWPKSPLRVQPGDKLTISYFSPDTKNHLESRTASFKVHSIAPIAGMLDDPDLTPEFPGITDKLDMASWENPPFPYNPKRVLPADEEYWKRYRTTPKAYINLKKARELWASRFGGLTSIQVRMGQEHPDTFPAALLAELRPEQGGFVFQPVRAQALHASSGATDFGVLFLSFSFFLIASALLLVGLLVRLNSDRRAGEMGVLLATGWDHGKVQRLLLGEGTLLASAGGLVGLAGALLYAWLMLRLLAFQWPGGANLNFLRLHAAPSSFVIGYFGSLIVSVLTLYWATRVLGKLSPRALLSGATTPPAAPADARPGWSRWLIPAGILGALALVAVAPFVPSHEAQAGSFFGSGALMLTACLAAVWQGLQKSPRISTPQPTLTRLGMRNAGRHAVRSVLTVGLLAAASFLIVAVESFHKDTDRQFLTRAGGSGGFPLYAEGSIPVFEDLNQAKARREHGLDTPAMRNVTFYPCRVQPGDDASCLNLYKPLQPRVLGVPSALVRRGGFAFASSLAQTEAEKGNPWLLLQPPAAASTEALPAILDANTAQWILKVALGDTLEVRDDQGQPVKLRVVALLAESIFQSEILIADASFLTLFPRQEGFSFLLVDAPGADPHTVDVLQQELGTKLMEFGLDVQTTASRLQGYLAVENTYLATFQALGGLGLLLGAVGLGIVLLRGVWERRAELALLRALGFRSAQLAWLVLAENLLLLVLGLAAGTLSALLAVAPHLVGLGAQVLWLRIVLLLILVLAVGLAAGLLAVQSVVRTPVLTALRRE